MPKKQKKVHVMIEFDQDGNITNVKVPGSSGSLPDKDIVSKSVGTITDVIGMAAILIKSDDDPCIVQGGVKWCW
jgi:hypothetical protein